MEKQIAKKVSRYLQLSRQFSKSASDLFGNQSNGCSGDYMTLTGVSGGTIYYGDAEPKEFTRAEKILERAQEEAKRADEFDEFLTLQNELTQYFNALLNLTK